MMKERKRSLIVGNLLAAAAAVLAAVCVAEEPQRARDNLSEPVLRVASKAPAPKHPLDPALDLARNGLQKIQATVNDYTCTLVKREQIDGKLLDYEYMFVKVRNRKVVDGKIVAPFSVYMYFLKPTDVKGREVMYVEGRNEERWSPTRAARRGSTCRRSGSSPPASSPCGTNATQLPTWASRI